MNTLEQQHFDYFCHQHLIKLKLQGKRPVSIDAYSRAVRRITAYFDRTPDTLSTNYLQQYFNALIQSFMQYS
ncbi:MAG: integrase/recombinase XerD [Oleiphilaceae bacterium]|jgi:integrase/recombinase XerD